VSKRDLMAPMGHDSMQAAIMYQHASAEAGAQIAVSLEAEITTRVDGDLSALANEVDANDPANTYNPAGR
jgi:hypothetical protein